MTRDPKTDFELPDDWGDEAPPTPEELAQAEALRLALEDPSLSDPHAELARAIALAHSPKDIAHETHERLIAQAQLKLKKPASGGQVIRVAFGGVMATLALAAGVFLFVRAQSTITVHTSTGLSLAHRRSTQNLFSEKFPTQGGASTRIQRIATAREREMRSNRFAQWGVK
jgi:hypothetical protein